MRCPDCRLDLVILEVDGVELDFCLDHHGVWFDHDELCQLFERAGAGAELPDLEARLLGACQNAPRTGSAGFSSTSRRSKRHCPRCSKAMQEVSLDQGPVLDACPRGHGLWFDPGEVQQLAVASLSAESPGLQRVNDYLDDFFHPVKAKP